jgi:membrane protease YdiL (CAAX protease family)
LLAGPLGGAALYFASHAGLVELPRPGLAWTALANALVLAPVLEELVFRGGIQGALERTRFGASAALRDVSVGNLMTSVLFSAAHLIAAPAWLAAGVFLPSLVFGRLKQLYPSLVPAMLVHAWYNACYLAATLV